MSSEETPAAATPSSTDTFTAPAAPPSNLVLGVVAGAAAAIVGALVWAGIAYATNMVIGYIAIGIGFLVGLAMRKFGRGSTQVFGLAGAALALAGCLLGDLLTVVAMASKEMQVGMVEVFRSLPSDIMVTIIKEQDPIGWLIYGLAVYAGFKYSVAPAPATAPVEPTAAT